MRYFKSQPASLFLILFSACLLFSCSGSSASNAVGDSSSSAMASASGSGDDMFYELTTVSTGKNINMKMVMDMYVSSKGDMRVEMHSDMNFRGHKSPIPMVLIGHSNKPDESIIIDDSAKTYMVHHIDTADMNAGIKTESTASKVGEENVAGYHCVHAKIISNKKIGSFFDASDTINLWRSKDVPMQADVKALFTQFESRSGGYMYSKETVSKLKEMGCEGFTVQMITNAKDHSTVMKLTKAEHKSLPASMFQIPSGYKEVKSDM